MIRKSAIVFAMVLIFTAACAAASFKEDVGKGNLLYNDKKYPQAVKSYEEALRKNPKAGIASFNIGSARYRQGSYSAAIEYFNKAIASGESRLVPPADFNIGNAQYRVGASRERTGDVKKAKELYETALKFYKRSIDLDPSDKDAKFNYEFVEKALKELEEKSQQNQQQKEQEKQQKQQERQKQQEEQEKEQKDKQQDQGKGGEGKEGEGKGKEGGGEGEGGEGKTEEKGEDRQGDEAREEEQDGQGSESKSGPEEKSRDEEAEAAPREESEKKEWEHGAGLSAYQSPHGQGEAAEMTEQEAKMLLEGYKGEEATGRAIHMRKKRRDLSEPARDW